MQQQLSSNAMLIPCCGSTVATLSSMRLIWWVQERCLHAVCGQHTHTGFGAHQSRHLGVRILPLLQAQHTG